MKTAASPTRPTVHRLRLRDDRGQTLLEFAFASVMFFILVFGTIEFGRAVWQYNMMADLAQQGARWLSVRGSTSTLFPKDDGALQDFVQGRSPGFTVTAIASPGNLTSRVPGTVITVQVSSTFSPVTALIPGTTMNLSSTARMTIFR